MRVVGSLAPDVHARLAGGEQLATLEEVLAWCHARGYDVIDVIVQDEFTHDVLVRAAAPAYVCFDTT